MKMLVMITATLGSAIGWWCGEPFGIMTAFMASCVGLGLGVWVGRRLGHHWSL